MKELFWKKKGSPTKLFVTVRKSIFDKIVIHHPMQFFWSRNFLKKRVLLGVLSVLWDKKVSRKSRDIPLPAIKNSDKSKFLKNEGFPYKVLRYCEKINFRQNRDTLSYAIFIILKFSETKRSPYKIFWYCETKSFRDKIVIPLFCIKTFDTTNFLKHRIVPLRNFPALWDKKISTVNNDNPLLSFKTSDTRVFLEDRESPYWNFRYWEKNNFRQNRDTSSYASFLIQKFSETKGSS